MIRVKEIPRSKRQRNSTEMIGNSTVLIYDSKVPRRKFHLHRRKNRSGPIKKWSRSFFLTLYTGNNQVTWLMIEKGNSTHARNHRKARQAHMKKMVRNEAFTRLSYSKRESDPYHENMVRKVYTAKICGPPSNFLMGPDPFFSVA